MPDSCEIWLLQCRIPYFFHLLYIFSTLKFVKMYLCAPSSSKEQNRVKHLSIYSVLHSYQQRKKREEKGLWLEGIGLKAYAVWSLIFICVDTCSSPFLEYSTFSQWRPWFMLLLTAFSKPLTVFIYNQPRWRMETLLP